VPRQVQQAITPGRGRRPWSCASPK
jgi:hypothetical protein